MAVPQREYAGGEGRLPSGYFNIAAYDVEALIEKERMATATMLSREPLPEPGAPEKLFIAYFGRKRAQIPDEEYEKARAIRHRISERCWQSDREDAQRLRNLKVSPPTSADRRELAKLMQQPMD